MVTGSMQQHLRRHLALIGVSVGAAASLRAQRAPLPPDTLLHAIEARGRALAAYDQAAWRATDAALALKPAPGLVTHYIARPADRGWVVSFGRLSEDSFLVVTKSFIFRIEADGSVTCAIRGEEP
jgi:hypothetical protein